MGEQRFAARVSAATLRNYRHSFALLTSLMPSLTLELLTTSAMTEFFRRLSTRARRSGTATILRGVKTSTVATYRSKLNRFFTWLALRGHIQENPLSALPYPRVEYEDRKFLGRADIERILAAVLLSPSFRTRFLRRRNIAIFSLLLYTGVRKGELLALRVSDVDLDHLHVTIRAGSSKSRRMRTLPINSSLALALGDYLEERRKRRLRSEYMLCSSAGDSPLTANGLKHLVERVKRDSGVRFHLHQFRHTFAVNLLNQGADVSKLKQLLGHRDIRMTSSYLRALPTSALRIDVEALTLDALL